MTYSEFNSLPKASSSKSIILEVKLSVYEFGEGDKNIQSITDSVEKRVNLRLLS